MRVRMTQHPVGQGGLFYGSLHHRDGEFKWIYDCGSTDSTELRREIDNISTQCNGAVDALYLSHFHKDHIVGIDYLTKVKKIEFDDVIVPYLNDIERLATLADHELNEDNLSDSIKEFIMTPEKFFLERGFSRVIMVDHVRDGDDRDLFSISGLPDDPGGAASTRDLRRDDEPSVDGRGLRQIWNPGLTTISHRLDKDIILCKAKDEAVAEIDVSKLTRLRIEHKWAFVTHARSIYGSELAAFQTKIRNIINEFQITELKDIIDKKNQKCYDKIVECYNEIWKDRNQNSISMSLYIGPQKDQPQTDFIHIINVAYSLGEIYVRANNFLHRVFHGFPYWLHWRYRCQWHKIKSFKSSGCGGILLTGDSIILNFKNDSKKNYRDQFEYKYQDYMPYVNVLMVPHHGSDNNYVSREFFDFFKNLDVCYVAANNRKHPFHPHQDVKDMVSKSILFHIVNTQPESVLEVNCDIYDLG